MRLTREEIERKLYIENDPSYGLFIQIEQVFDDEMFEFNKQVHRSLEVANANADTKYSEGYEAGIKFENDRITNKLQSFVIRESME